MNYTTSEVQACHFARQMWREQFKDQEYTPEQAFILGITMAMLTCKNIAQERNRLKIKLRSSYFVSLSIVALLCGQFFVFNFFAKCYR